MSLAVVVIASEKRRESTFPRVLDSIRNQTRPPEEIVVVADFPVQAKGVRSLVVAPMTRTTVDALVKRDVGWLATTSESVLFLCDDHALDPNFVARYLDRWAHDPLWHILVPARYCERDLERVWLNVGRDYSYCAGHAGLFRRVLSHALPWSATYHHPNWDVLHSHQLVAMGAKLMYAENDLAVQDLEPEAQPWFQTEDQAARTEAFHRSIAGRV
jgi:glycosyltransferase involved in cell wall biosynthesis